MLYDKEYAQSLHVETKEIRNLIWSLFNRTALNLGIISAILVGINSVFYYVYFTSNEKSVLFHIMDSAYYCALAFSFLTIIYLELRLFKTIMFFSKKWQIFKYALSERFVYSMYDSIMKEVDWKFNSVISIGKVKELFIIKMNDKIFDNKETFKKGVYKKIMAHFEDELKEKAFEFMMKNLRFRGILVPVKGEYYEPKFVIVFKGKDGSYGESDYKPHLAHEKGKFEDQLTTIAA